MEGLVVKVSQQLAKVARCRKAKRRTPTNLPSNLSDDDDFKSDPIVVTENDSNTTHRDNLFRFDEHLRRRFTDME
ncbi:hypothetical protein ZHAS_00016214 [Anopheles sinensis]|uniref:Uncharacterized protein n=1 Tax=Anopheles sinensis TaxID=74873 RepID=A0A084WD56_ANOSI|nr:hypothetical protein ZHAS_00016214 [Anopheles sinensis]